jgi:hypothetical protein
MRILCFFCHKSVSNELPDNTIFRAIATCPECIESGKDKDDESIREDWNIREEENRKKSND